MMTPASLRIGGVALLCVALNASAQVRYSVQDAPATAVLAGGGRAYETYRLPAGGQLTFAVQGPGVLKLLYFHEHSAAVPLPREAKLLVSIDGAGKMFPVSLAAGDFTIGGARATKPSAPANVMLKLDAGEHVVVVKLAAGTKLGGFVTLPNAEPKAADDDLALELPDPGLALDLELPPAPPAKAAKPADALALDLDLDLAPAPAAPPPAKPAPDALALDLDLDLAPVAPEPPKAAEPKKPTEVAVAARPPEPKKPEPARPPSPPVAQKVVPVPTRPPAPPVAQKPPAPPKPPLAQKPPAPPKAPPVPEGPPPPLGPLEIGPRAGYALSRDRLAGQGVYLMEIGYRVQPQLRATVTSGYTLLTGSWQAVEPGRGFGRFYQNSHVVPLELGVTWEPASFGLVTPYLGAGLALGLVQSDLQRFSLAPARRTSLLFGGSVAAGLRVRLGPGVVVLDLRHTEAAVADGTLATAGQQRLPTSAATGGYLLSF